MNHFQKTGFCHVFGDDLPLDEGLIPFQMAIERIDDPALLVPELLRAVSPSFAARVQQGDILVAGRRFACGKPHFQGFIAMAALGMSALCESIPYKSLRGAISKGVPVLSQVRNDHGQFRDGDRVTIDFMTGEVTNHSQGTAQRVAALPPVLTDIVMRGGSRGFLADWLREHPQAATASPPVQRHTPA
ncbi:3-isopropylmalate dehydratase [Hydrogenophaga sp. BPS33]|uniref:3-isopropylmalate dehydratase n=1 Tax=Hydrogenophaga sp. BPS33 TaxID=2651974 RepID=UPI0013202FAC|nr:3-isopropylmalate dehydratase [Hydrogenophaga sp. BPS33]QHE87860.1 3-isopropylmalate dehydratase [Hydrogenophaga sp. BPS33]